MPFLVVGLGNPGEKYKFTRHNAGFLAIDELARRMDASFKAKKDLSSEVAEVSGGETKVVLAKPVTYMNLSGSAVALLCKRYKVDPHNVLVITDDVDLEPGKIRTRLDGSSGGHNGLKSLIAALGTQQFARIKIGVGQHPERIPLEDWVLQKFPKEDQPVMEKSIVSAADLAEDFLRGRFAVQTVTIAAE